MSVREFTSLPFIFLMAFALTAGATFAAYNKGLFGGGTYPALLQFADFNNANTDSQKFDALRELVNAHTRNKSSAQNIVAQEHSGRAREAAYVYDYAAGVNESPPALNSRERAVLLRTLLEAEGYKSRLVTLIGPASQNSEHTMIEIYNPVRRAYELHDPVYNVFYVFRNTEQRVSLEDMLRQPVINFTPCHMDGYCSWQSLSPEGLNAAELKLYFTAALIEDGDRRTFAYNRRRFNPGSFCAGMPEACSGDMIVYE